MLEIVMKLLLSMFILATISASSFAWRETGHYSVCEIAYKTSKPKTRKILDRIFEGKAYAVQCTWADHVRKTPEYGQTYDWHFINLDPGEEYFKNISKKGDALQAIINLQDELISKRSQILNSRRPIHGEKAREIREALKFLGHFVGDIHQPLHVGHKRDLGGNRISVSWDGVTRKAYRDFKIVKGAHLHASDKERDVSLHKVLDEHFFDKLLKQKDIDLGETGTGYEDYSQKLLDGKIIEIDKSKFTEYADAPAGEWLKESLDERTQLYRVRRGQELAQDYFDQHKDLINLKVLKAGLRLGKTLDNIFDKDFELSSKETELREKIQSALISN